MKQIIVNVIGLSVEEKQRVNEALAKITGATKLPVINPVAVWFFAPSSCSSTMVTWSRGSQIEEPTHTPQQVLEMAGMAKQGHVHAHLMALYAEDAKTTDKPWDLWQIKAGSSDWISCKFSPAWDPRCQFRRKPKNHIVHGVEVPDLRITPKNGEWYYLVGRAAPEFTYSCKADEAISDSSQVSMRLCYEYTDAGKQAAILHAKAWWGIA